MKRYIIHYVTFYGQMKGATIIAPNVTRAIELYHSVGDCYKIISINKG